MRAPQRPDEAQRLAALEHYDVVGAESDDEFDQICSLAATLCDAPIAFVNFVAEDHQWSQAAVGTPIRRLDLDTAFCPHALLEGDFLEIEDAARDPRFAGNRLVVGDPHIRFYAGAVMRSSEGLPLGTVCVLDHEPRTLTDAQRDSLKVLAKHVMHRLELRRSLREQEALTARVQAALDDRQRLLFTVAHDIRTPLNVIKISSGMLAEGTAPQEMLTPAIARASADLVALLDSLLVRERLAIQRLDVQALDAAEVLRAVAEQIQPIALGARVHFVTRHEGPTEVQADPDRMGQALLNLVTNAVRHSPEAGVVELRSTASDTSWCLEVVDQGPGIPLEAQERIFESFQQVHRRADGHGLGLAIVRHLVQAHGGTVEVESAPGQGCRFVVVLPREAGPQ